MLMTDTTGREKGAHGDHPDDDPDDDLLTTGEIASLVGRNLTHREIVRMVKAELIPYFRIGDGWYQIPRWVAGELRRRAQEQIRLSLELGALVGDDPETETQRDEIRQQLAVLRGPITERPAPESPLPPG